MTDAELEKYLDEPTAYDMDGSRMSMREWARRSTENPNWRRVAYTEIGARYVSTVLLGINHGMRYGGPPIIFESMAFPEQDLVERYSTKEEALAGHERMVAEVRLLPPTPAV